jgi:hypothetical protein
LHLKNFHNKHAGETCLLVGNGPNLSLTPPECFPLTSIGMNTVHLYEGWKPNYYTTVDSRVMREFGAGVVERLGDIPKFIPTPNLDKWQGPNFYRFYHRPGPLWTPQQGGLWREDALENGITYSNVMHIAIQLAYYMGFATMLIVGMQHKPRKAQAHFWGTDHGMGADMPLEDWFEGYKILRESMAERGVRMINVSEDTYVPVEILPRDDWRNYASEISTRLSGT